MSVNPREVMERELARLLRQAEEVARDIEAVRRDIAEHDRIAAKYGEPGGGGVEEFVKKTSTESPAAGSDGLTVAGLITAYRLTPHSPYHKLRFKTRANYDSVMGRLRRELGDERVGNLDAERLQAAHKKWTAEGHLAMGHALVGMLRILATFGSTILKDHDCRALRVTLHDLKFKNSQPRTQHLTSEHAVLIRMTAREMGLPSMALAQAIQFDTGLRQKDVIGEFVPVGEPGVSEITWDPYGKWLRGIRWNQIDENLVLRHVTSAGEKDVEFDLRRAGMVMDELRSEYCKIGEQLTRDKLPSNGPIIVNERTGKPYLTHTFRRTWRLIADSAGVPKSVKNMDSRAGAERALAERRNTRHIMA